MKRNALWIVVASVFSLQIYAAQPKVVKANELQAALRKFAAPYFQEHASTLSLPSGTKSHELAFEKCIAACLQAFQIQFGLFVVNMWGSAPSGRGLPIMRTITTMDQLITFDWEAHKDFQSHVQPQGAWGTEVWLMLKTMIEEQQGWILLPESKCGRV